MAGRKSYTKGVTNPKRKNHTTITDQQRNAKMLSQYAEITATARDNAGKTIKIPFIGTVRLY